MYAKTVFVVFCATLAVSIASKNGSDVVNTLLGSMTNVIREVAKVTSNDTDKIYDADALYKKFVVDTEVAEKARTFIKAKLNQAVQMFNENLKQMDIETEERMKLQIESMKYEDPVYVEKTKKLYEVYREYHRVAEDYIKNYILNADIIENNIITSLRSFEKNLIEMIQKFESAVTEGVKKSNGKV